MPTAHAHRSRLTWVLFFSRSLASAGYIAGATIGTLVGAELSGQKALAGVPGAIYLLGNALAAYPAARLMERVGRRPGLTLGFGFGSVGALICGVAILNHSFGLFCLGFILMGVAQGFSDLGRYAAAEMHLPAERGSAISLVVLGGTVGAILGPNLVGPMGRWAESLEVNPLVGPWFASMGLFILGGALIFTFLRPDPRDIGRELAPEEPHAATGPVRSIPALLRLPGIQLAIAAMALGQLVMVMIMAITSLHMKGHGHNLDDIGYVIMFHTIGMFGPSLFSGKLVDRFGRAQIIVAGAGILIVACLVAPLSPDVVPMGVALFLLGMGWNFCYVAGGTLLTDVLTLAERGRMQGAMDLLVALSSAVGNLGSGAVFAAFGYALMTYTSLAATLVPLVLAVNFLLRKQQIVQVPVEN